MNITIKYKESNCLKYFSKVTVLQDEVEISLTGSYYVIDGEYCYRDTDGQVSIVASNEAEFKQYLIDVEQDGTDNELNLLAMADDDNLIPDTNEIRSDAADYL